MMYFEFSTYFRLLRLTWGEANRRARNRMLFLLLAVVPAVSSLHAICFLLDRLFFPRLSRTEVRQPVFIVGHARSGTTLMHRLMARDGERFSYFLLYELFFPSLLQKKLLRFLGSCDRRYWGSRLEKRLQAWEERKFARTQDLHRMGLWAPDEDDFILTFSCASGFWIVQAPYLDELDFYHLDTGPARRRRRLMRFYKECLKRQLYLNGPEKIHLSKNPTYCGRVESLLETFPDARIVVLERDPRETIPSLFKLMKTSWMLRKWPPERYRTNFETLAEHSFDSYLHPLEVLERHPETTHAIVHYRDLVEAPRRTVREVYEKLGFELSPEFDKALEEEDARARKHETSHRYSLEEFGLHRDEIHRRLGPLFERFGWETE